MPYARLPYIDEQGAARSPGGEDNIIHFNAVRLRVNGEGSLKLTLFGSDDLRNTQLKDLPMSMRPGRHPTILTNFIEQHVSLEVKTISINDFFQINRIIIFSKEFASSYPS